MWINSQQTRRDLLVLVQNCNRNLMENDQPSHLSRAESLRQPDGSSRLLAMQVNIVEGSTRSGWSLSP